jgi:hypothetical protein
MLLKYLWFWQDRIATVISDERRTQRRRTFQNVYKNNLWGRDKNGGYFSGPGSRGEAAALYVTRMTELLNRHTAEFGRPITVVDLGCGDFCVGQALVTEIPELIYVGCDIVPEVIRQNDKLYSNSRVIFRQLDIVTDPLPEGDVYLVRQVLQHLSNHDIIRFLGRLSCSYLYVTEGHPTELVGPANPDKVTGPNVRFDWKTGRGRGVELDQPPFNLTTQELFRVFSSKEVIVTQRVFLLGGAGSDGG